MSAGLRRGAVSIASRVHAAADMIDAVVNHEDLDGRDVYSVLEEAAASLREAVPPDAVDWKLVASFLALELARSDDADRALCLLASLAEHGTAAHRPAYAAAADLLADRIREAGRPLPESFREPSAEELIQRDRVANAAA